MGIMTTVLCRKIFTLLVAPSLVAIFFSSEIIASQAVDRKVYAVPKLSQGPNFQAFVIVTSQGHGQTFIHVLPDDSYHQRGLVLPATSMHMVGAVVHEGILKMNERNYPGKVGLLNRPTLVVGGKLSGVNNEPHINFIQLRLPYVRLKEKQDPVQNIWVDVKLTGLTQGISQGVSGVGYLGERFPYRVTDRVPWGSLLPKGLPDDKVSQIIDINLMDSDQNVLFASELYQAIQFGAAINISVHEEHSDIWGRNSQRGKKLYEIEYSFKGEPHESANRNLNIIIKNGVNDLMNGKGQYVAEIKSPDVASAQFTPGFCLGDMPPLSSFEADEIASQLVSEYAGSLHLLRSRKVREHGQSYKQRANQLQQLHRRDFTSDFEQDHSHAVSIEQNHVKVLRVGSPEQRQQVNQQYRLAVQECGRLLAQTR